MCAEYEHPYPPTHAVRQYRTTRAVNTPPRRLDTKVPPTASPRMQNVITNKCAPAPTKADSRLALAGTLIVIYEHPSKL